MKLRKILIYIILFYLIYTPNFSYLINETLILSKHITIPLIFIFFLLLQLMKKKELKIKSHLVFFSLGITLSAIYFVVVALVNYHSSISNLRIYQNLFILLHFFTILLFCNLIKSKYKYNNQKLIKIILNIGLIQATICLLMLVIPEFKELANKLYLGINGQNNKIMLYTSTIRIYGISDDYTFLTPIYHGFLASIALLLAIKDNKKYYIYIPFLLIACVLNGRTGLIVFIINCILIYLNEFIYSNNKSKIIKSLIFILIIGFISLLIIKTYIPSTFKFINSGINSIVSYFSPNESTGNMKILTEEMTFWPQNLYLIFGTGQRVYSGTERTSDIGYVNDAFMGGLIYMFILYTTIIFAIYNKNIKNNYKSISLISLITLILANYKGEAMRGGILITMIILIIELFTKESQNEKR